MTDLARWGALLIFAGGLVGGPARAADPARATDPTSATDPASAADPSEGATPKTLLVMSFSSTGVESSAKTAVEDLTAAAMLKTKAFKVVTSADLTKMLELEAQKFEAGCDSTSCLAEVADAMGADLIVTGRMARLGERIILKLSLMEPATATTVALETVNVDALEAFGPALQPIANAFATASGAEAEAPTVGLASVVFGSGAAVLVVGGVAAIGMGAAAAYGFGILMDPGSPGDEKATMQTLTPLFLGAFVVSAGVAIAGAATATAGLVME